MQLGELEKLREHHEIMDIFTFIYYSSIQGKYLVFWYQVSAEKYYDPQMCGMRSCLWCLTIPLTCQPIVLIVSG